MASKVRQAVIMVGGKGTRLRPLTDTCPKPMLPVLDRPCLDYLIGSMIDAGIEHIILACGYMSEQIPKMIGDGSDRGITIKYSHEDEPMGTAGAIKLLEDRLDQVFVAANGDVFADIDVGREIQEHFDKGACVTISLTPVENPCEFGIVRTAEDGRIIEFKEKPKPEEVFSDLINAGVYVVNRDVLKLVPEGRAYDFSKELIIDLIEKGHRVQGHRTEGLWKDVGRPSDLLEVNIIMAERKGTGVPEGEVTDSSVEPPFHAGPGSRIEGSSMSSAIISRNSTVKDSVVSGTLVMEGSEISGSRITRSIIGKGCIITDCELSGAVLGDGTEMKGMIMELPPLQVRNESRGNSRGSVRK